MVQKAPYAGLRDPAIWMKISNGVLPEFTDEISKTENPQIVALRDICKQCWERDRERRPAMKVVLKALEDVQLNNTP